MTAAGTWVVTISTAVTRRFVVLHFTEDGAGLVGRAVSGADVVEEVELVDIRYDDGELSWLHPLSGVTPDDSVVEVAFSAKVKGDLMTGRSQSHFDASVIGTRSSRPS